MRIQNLPTSLTNAWDRLSTGSASSPTSTSSTGGAASFDTADEFIPSDDASATTPSAYQNGELSTKPLGELKFDLGNLEQKIGGLQARLVKLFAEHGIDDAAGVSLRTGSDGRVNVVGDHPQKTEIEQLFADDPQLRNSFVEVQAQSEFKRAAEEAIAFQEAYRKNPQQALEEFKYLFQERTDVFTLQVRDGQAKVTFEPK